MDLFNNFINLDGVTIGMFRNGFKTNKSLSPVTRKSAPDAIVAVKRWLSSGSRHLETFNLGWIRIAFSSRKIIRSKMSSLLIKFLNLGLRSILQSSSKIVGETTRRNSFLINDLK